VLSTHRCKCRCRRQIPTDIRTCSCRLRCDRRRLSPRIRTGRVHRSPHTRQYLQTQHDIPSHASVTCTISVSHGPYGRTNDYHLCPSSSVQLPPPKVTVPRGKTQKVRCHLDLRYYFFSNCVIDRRNGLPQRVMDSGSLNSFGNGLDIMRTKMGFFMDKPVRWALLATVAYQLERPHQVRYTGKILQQVYQLTPMDHHAQSTIALYTA